MNTSTTLYISLRHYYFLVNAIDGINDNQEAVEVIFARLIVRLAKEDPALAERLNFKTRHHLHVKKKDRTFMVVGTETMTQLSDLLKLKGEDLSLAAMVLLNDYQNMDIKNQRDLLKA